MRTAIRPALRALVPALAVSAVVLVTLVWPRAPVVVTEPEAPTPASIEVTPHAESVLYRGQAQRFTAVVRDRHGNPLDGVRVSWSVAPRAGTIDSTGLFVATTACLRWDAIALVVASWDPATPGSRPLRDGALVAVRYDPRCLPPPTAPAAPPAGELLP